VPFVHTRAVLAVVLAGCGGGSEYDPFPVAVDLSAGPVLTTASEADGTPVPAVIDTLQPVSLVDEYAAGQEPAPALRRTIDLHLYDVNGVLRASFNGTTVFDFHPCARSDGPCQIGTGADLHDVRVLIGSDVLARTAVRFDLPASAIRFFPDIAGDDGSRTRNCDAVFPGTLAGGGTILLGDSEVNYNGDRVALPACLGYQVDTAAARVDGADVLMLLATGLPVSVLGASAWERYRAAIGDDSVAPPRASLPAVQVWLPGGPVDAGMASITRIALLGPSGDSEETGPCKELYDSHAVPQACSDGDAGLGPCPCPGGGDRCTTAAGVEIDRSFPVAVIDDTSPLLQTLRDELRPALPEVDGLLAPGALAPVILDVDYPNARVLARCGDPVGCTARPRITSKAIAEVKACLGL